MYYVYTNGNANFEIEFLKLGITIRRINKKERKELKERYKKTWGLRKKFFSCIDLYKMNFSQYKKLRTELELEDNIIDYLVHEWRFYERKPIFHNSLEPLFERIMVIDINEDKLKKYIEPEAFNIFLRQFINLSFIYSEKKKNNDNNDRLQFISGRYNINPNEELISKYLFDEFSFSSAHVLISSSDFKKYCDIMHKFFSNLNSDDVFRFIEIMEMHNIKNAFMPNLLINNILIIESLIVKDDKDLAKEFVRKTALFLISGNSNYRLTECVSILEYLYNVRSDIVHGNTSKLFNDFSKLKETLPNLKYPRIDRESKMHKKSRIVEFSYIISNQILNDIIKLWLANPDELDFIKKC